MSWTYIPKNEEQLNKWYKSKVSERISEFVDYNDFIEWYNEKEKTCFYCGLTEIESQEVVHKGLLKSKRFPLNGLFSKGVNRSYWLEVDRKNPQGLYSRQNCELSCYYCNNDKSDVFNDEQYKEFVKDRPGFIRSLLENQEK